MVGRNQWVMRSVLVFFFGILSATVQAGLVYVDALYDYSLTTVQFAQATTNSGNVSLLADIYQPVFNGRGAVPVNRPALVLQDGGAWVSASRTNGRVTDPARYFARRGYTVIVTDYRQGSSVGGSVTPTVGNTQFGTAPYAGLGVPFPYNFVPGTTAVRAGIEDFAVAIDWVRTNSSFLGIDPMRIAAGGGSAGAINLLMLQYNNNPIDQRYAAQAVVALVGSTYGNFNKIQAGGPPVFLHNNTLDAVVPWEQGMLNRFLSVGIDTEIWYQPPDLLYHNVDWNMDLDGMDLRGRVRDFLARTVATPYVVPEPSSLALCFVMLTLVTHRKRRVLLAQAA
jgi:dienelactone hydrolase